MPYFIKIIQPKLRIPLRQQRKKKRKLRIRSVWLNR